MLSRLLRIFRKIAGLPEKDSALWHLKKGMLRIGHNSSVREMKITIRNLKQGDVPIIVGDDCVISGHFVIEKQGGKIIIGDRTFIGGGTFIASTEISIGSDVMFSWGCTVTDTDAHSLDWKERLNDVKQWKKGLDENDPGKYKNWNNVPCKPVVIENNAWIGFNSIILKGVTIGKGSVVGAGSVVRKNVEPMKVVTGNPASVTKNIEG